MATQDDIQRRFVELLVLLTESGKLDWVRSEVDIGFVYCLAQEELIVFEVRGNGGQRVDPMDTVRGFVSKCRNVTYLWLEPTPGFSDLLKLLRSASMDEQKFSQFTLRSQGTPVQLLEKLIQ